MCIKRERVRSKPPDKKKIFVRVPIERKPVTNGKEMAGNHVNECQAQKACKRRKRYWPVPSAVKHVTNAGNIKRGKMRNQLEYREKTVSIQVTCVRKSVTSDTDRSVQETRNISGMRDKVT